MKPLDEHMTTETTTETTTEKTPEIGDFRIIKKTGNTTGDIAFFIEYYRSFFVFWRRWSKIKETYVSSSNYGNPKPFSTYTSAYTHQQAIASSKETFTIEIVTPDSQKKL
jgi:hypothetical protein